MNWSTFTSRNVLTTFLLLNFYSILKMRNYSKPRNVTFWKCKHEYLAILRGKENNYKFSKPNFFPLISSNKYPLQLSKCSVSPTWLCLMFWLHESYLHMLHMKDYAGNIHSSFKLGNWQRCRGAQCSNPQAAGTWTYKQLAYKCVLDLQVNEPSSIRSRQLIHILLHWKPREQQCNTIPPNNCKAIIFVPLSSY